MATTSSGSSGLQVDIVLSEFDRLGIAELENCKEMVVDLLAAPFDIAVEDIKLDVVRDTVGISARLWASTPLGPWLLIKGAARGSFSEAVAQLRTRLVQSSAVPVSGSCVRSLGGAPTTAQTIRPFASGPSSSDSTQTSTANQPVVTQTSQQAAAVRIPLSVLTSNRRESMDWAPTFSPWASSLPQGLTTAEIIRNHKECLGGDALLELLDNRHMSYYGIVDVLRASSDIPMTQDQRVTIRNRLAWRTKTARRLSA